ncbi:actin-related protein 2/3 complex, subunit 1 [Gonapodya prolifera JEL478]|uniref:Actin-related protein 2/3 complex subunit n=1 Tax=Gonapodya prolifera (strain JEL478) TaxID=1344416 RepID=A0A139AAU9_GONPJ|nr:actin-related protein 2/3 complex, subunit 1 [Gonapodya prolifera JEL478]|eukprot:KXS13779.1 actin-related protein 2/3 complex, subunit 1 [Gonapodya prolifera JEL478]
MASAATPADIQQIVSVPISAHAYNKDRTKVAIVPNSNEVHIYDKGPDGWVLSDTLKEHGQLVTSVDWAPTTNRLVTCSQDRNAYVWNWNATKRRWDPDLVLLRINRAATCVRWSPAENKFAVASGAKTVSVCYYEEENKWWVSKHIKKPIKSTVLAIDWHPNNLLLAAGSADMTVRVYAAYIKEVDSKGSAAPWAEGRLTFAALLAEYDTGALGWAHSVAFSPSGGLLAWTSHGSSASIADPVSKQVETVRYGGLPLVSSVWLNEDAIVAAGHDCYPVLVARRSGRWEYIDKLDQQTKRAPSAALGSLAMNRFRQMDSKAQQGKEDTDLQSVHQNTITEIVRLSDDRAHVSAFSTAGVDGRIVRWEVKGF